MIQQQSRQMHAPHHLMACPYRYTTHGLTIASAIALPELLPAAGPPEVVIRYGKTPEALPHPMIQNGFSQSRGNETLLTLEAVAGARFFVRDGHEIVVEQVQAGSHADLRLFLLGSCLGALLLQRGCMPLHANAIATPKGAVAFCGVSGAGKSTLAAAFYQRGYQVLVDDVCAVSVATDGHFAVEAGYPSMKLWADALSKCGEDVATLHRIRRDVDKYHLPLAGAFCHRRQRLHAIYLLQPAPISRPSLAYVNGFKKLRTLQEHVYKVTFAEAQSNWPWVFHRLTALAQQVRVCQVERPMHGFALQALADLVEMDFMT